MGDLAAKTPRLIKPPSFELAGTWEADIKINIARTQVMRLLESFPRYRASLHSPFCTRDCSPSHGLEHGLRVVLLFRRSS